MRQRHSSAAIASTIVLLFVLCVHAAAGDSGRAIVRHAPPIYPEIARQMHIAGTVMLTISIDPDGSVADIKVDRGHPILIDAAVNAVRKWKYVSAPVASQETVNITFEAH